MNTTEIMAKLTETFGNKVNIETITEKLKGVDTSKMSFSQIVDHVKGGLGDLDGDGRVESTFEEIKGKASEVLGGIFHH